MSPASFIFTITAYSFGCGGNHLTHYTERIPVPFFTAAADPKVLKPGTLIEITGPYGGTYLIEDSGSQIKGNHIDIYVGTCEQARWWGKRKRVIKILKED